jgi:hypothetical protein
MAELFRREIAQGPVRPDRVVVLAPLLDHLPSLVETRKPVLVETRVAKFAGWIASLSVSA